MDTGIGATLREARNRRKVDLSEVEAATKIRSRYLRAIENEQWDVLPGGAYTRGFIRTYAAYLGLDSERLASDYRQGVESPSGERTEVAPRATGPRAGSRLSSPVWVAIVSLVVVGLLVVIGVTGGGDNSSPRPAPAANRGKKGGKDRRNAMAAKSRVAVRVTANAEVWVCLLDAGGQPLINGQILEAGAEEGPFHSKRFTVSFGNGEVTVLIDGKEAEIPPSSGPLGYEIKSGGELEQLSESQRPTCT